MFRLFSILMTSMLGLMVFGCAKKMVVQPAPKISCPSCPSVEIIQCYDDTIGVVLFFEITKEDGTTEIVPAPSPFDPGCRCTAVVDGNVYVTTFPVSPEFCSKHQKEESSEETQTYVK